jgi:hypothetical protein
MHLSKPPLASKVASIFFFFGLMTHIPCVQANETNLPRAVETDQPETQYVKALTGAVDLKPLFFVSSNEFFRGATTEIKSALISMISDPYFNGKDEIRIRMDFTSPIAFVNKSHVVITIPTWTRIDFNGLLKANQLSERHVENINRIEGLKIHLLSPSHALTDWLHSRMKEQANAGKLESPIGKTTAERIAFVNELIDQLQTLETKAIVVSHLDGPYREMFYLGSPAEFQGDANAYAGFRAQSSKQGVLAWQEIESER